MNTSPIGREHTQLHVKTDLHLIRKIWHVSAGVTGIYLYFSLALENRLMAKILLALAMVGFIVDLCRLKLPKFNASVLKFMGPLMRKSEKNSISGLPYYALGSSLALFFYEEKLAILSILFLVFSDPISSLFGILYGREKILPNKSLQGSLAGFLTCYLITITYGLEYEATGLDLFIFALLAGLIGSLSELFSNKIDDNLTIPVLSGLGLTIINGLLPIF